MKSRFISVFIKFFTTAVTVTMLTALLINIITVWSVNEITRGGSVKSGYFCAIIGSGSMEPLISKHDLLLLEGASSYQVEDVITYVSPRGGMVTHRIKELSAQGYITQGDANNIPDGEIRGERVLGRVVFGIPMVGAVIDTILSPVGIIQLVSVFLLVYLIYEVRRGTNEDKTGMDKTSNTAEQITDE